ncbi:MAG: DoxX family protein [Candidatus Nitrosotenuis sp.]
MEANIKEGKLNDITHLGIRLAVGVIFLVHGIGKTANPDFEGFLANLGLPAEMAPLVALAEIVPGILLVIGVLSRVSSSLLSIIMLGAIFHVKKAANLTGQGAYELDLILLAANLSIITMGPGRISIAHIARKIPRFLH